MSNLRVLAATVLSVLMLGSAVPAFAQRQPEPSVTPAPPLEDDDSVLQPAEPDFRLINLPTTLRLPLFKSNFDLTHRFGGNFRSHSFGESASRLFGLDDGAVVGIEYRMAVARHVEAVFYRTAVERTIQLYTKLDLIHQWEDVPLSLSAVVSVEGADNFQEKYQPAVGVSLSRQIGDRFAAYVVPTFVHNTAATLGTDQNTSFVGFGARVRIKHSNYVAFEMSPRVTGFAPGTTQYGFAIEKRAGGHMFQLNFTNGNGTTLGQVARGGQVHNLAMGFNLSRKFF